MAYKKIMFEISGRCNALCKYCYTGRENRARSKQLGRFLPLDEFARALQYLFTQKLADQETLFGLYNFGEPLLHPEFPRIARIMHETNAPFEISTNGSVPLKSEAVKYLRHMETLKISMCGFSEESYLKISKLNFRKVKENIVQILNLLRVEPWAGVVSLKFHVYRHNLDEIPAARQFALENGMMFSPIHAIIGDMRLQTEFVEGLLPSVMIDDFSRDLLSADMFAKYASEMPKNWHCPLSDELVIDEDLNVLNCCMSSRNDMEDYQWHGSLFDLHTVVFERCQSPLARRCLESGAAYAFCSFPTHRSKLPIDKMLSILNESAVCVIGSGNVYTSFKNLFSRLGATWTHFASVGEFLASDSRSDPVIVASATFQSILHELHAAGIVPSQIKDIYHFNLLLRDEVIE